MPTANPDGFEKADKHRDGSARLNAHGIDLNRNFPRVELGQSSKNNVPIPKKDDKSNQLEPEVRALVHWSLIYPFILSGNLHGGSLVANYPFDEGVKGSTRGESKSPDDSTFQMLAKAYSYAHQKMWKGNACEKFHDGITNGAAWYVIEGGMQDWSYVYTSDMEVTIEIGCEKYPNENQLQSLWNDNKGALLAFITQVRVIGEI